MTQENLEKANRLDAERRYLKSQLREIESMKMDTITFTTKTGVSVNNKFQQLVLDTKVIGAAHLIDASKVIKNYMDAANKRIREIDREIKKL